MRKIFHLFLAVCFFVTSLPITPRAQNISPAVLERSVRGVVKGEKEATREKWRREYARVKEAFERETNPQKIAQLRNQMNGIIEQLTALDALDVAREEAVKNVIVQEPSTLYVAPRTPALIPQSPSADENSFLALVATNSIPFEDLIEYADPLEDPNLQGDKRIKNDLRTIVYATEMIGNTVDSISRDEPEGALDEINAILLRMQPRLLFQLYKLERQRLSGHSTSYTDPNRDVTMERIMAIGTLRITLLKIQRYYERIGVENPVNFAKSNQPVNTNRPFIMEAQRNPSVTLNIANVFSFGNPQTTPQWDPYQHMFDTMLQELQSYRHAGMEEDSAEYGHLLIAAEYATFYTVLYDSDKLVQLVELFDKEDSINPDFDEFKRKFSAVENTIFTTMFETVRFSPIRSGASEKMIELFKEFSNSSKYSISTNIFALEAASLMFRPFNMEYLNGQREENRLFVLNSVTPSKQDKDFFAKNISFIYCSLKDARSNIYGLDASEMEELANKLADMYNNLYDIVSNWKVYHLPGTPARDYPVTNCEITMTGNLNKRVRDKEIAGEILLFVGECLFWVYVGGPLFSALGNAFRATRGAIAVLPRAGRTASLASKGSRWSTFSTVVKNGAKGSNLVEHATKNGVQIVEAVAASTSKRTAAQAAATVARAEEGAAAALTLTEESASQVARAIGMETGFAPEIPFVLRPIKHTRQLMGKPRYFSWKNLFGGELSNPLETFAIKTAPDGTVSYFKLMGNSFRNMSYDELSLSRFTSLTNSSSVLSANLSWMERRTVASIMRHQNIIRYAASRGALDAFVPTQNGKFWNLSWGKLAAEDMGFSMANQAVYLLPRKSVFNIAVMGRMRIFNPLTAEQLTASGAVQTSLKELMDGKWVDTVFRHYFQPVSWGSKTADLLMPRFILTEEGIAALANPSFAAKMLQPTLLTSPLFQTALGFGVLKGIDYTIGYPLRQWYVNGMVQEDIEELMVTHPAVQRARQESEQEPETDVTHQQTPVLPTAQMSAYQSVIAAKRPSKDGATLLLPILMARRVAAKKLGIGSFNTINGEIRVSFDRQEMMAPYHTALKARNEAIENEIEQMAAKQAVALEKEKQDFERDLQKLQNQFFQYDWVKEMIDVEPSAKATLDNIFSTYNGSMLSLFSNNNLSPSQREQELTKIQETFNRQIRDLRDKVDEKQLEEGYYALALLEAEGADWNNQKRKYDLLWYNIMLGYQENFMQENPNLADYPDLSDTVRNALDEFLEEKKALFGDESDNVTEKSAEIDVRLVEKLDAVHASYLEREGESVDRVE